MNTMEILDQLSADFSTMDHYRRVDFFSKVLSLFGPYLRDNAQFAIDTSEALKQSGGNAIPLTAEEMAEQIASDFSAIDHNRRVAIFSRFISLFAPYIRENDQFLVDIFKKAEDSGVHVLPVHYYSPIPETSSYPDENTLPLLFGKDFGLNIPPASQNDFFTEVCKFSKELTDVPFNSNLLGEMRWNNGMFGVLDSCVYYAMIRKHQPSLVLEIGSGFSTLVAIAAASKNKSTKVECVEPYPVEFFSKHLSDLPGIELSVKRVQEVPLEYFSSLKNNDILFIDSSHVVKSGSDVEYLIFRVLPVLPSGVLVHFHDIYLPYSYPRSNLEQHKRFWNENYVLGAYLAKNKEWDILVSNCTLGARSNLITLCETISSKDNSKVADLLQISPGGSFWIRKT